ncbi:MAG: nucleotidyl transferase AbiEii/AbiGii toxin family protein [Ignavibacteriales bacterium]|nr:nucleotidyl transferase AbiEii/AbiGii toxin family protein [Ignavibacteriales bacterium]
MHKEILLPSQVELLPFIKKFKKDFYLVGGTAIALQLGHRRSIDFDLFINAESLNLKYIKNEYKKVLNANKSVLYEAFDQFHIKINDVKITFFTYPYPVKADLEFESICRMPDLLELV